MTLTNKNIQSKLDKVNEDEIKHKILNDLLDHSDEPEDRQAYLEDAISHGCQSGMVSDLIYYEDTGKFYDKHETEIWEMLEEQSESFGQSVFEMIAGFNGADNVRDLKTFKNLLAWYAYEEKAREILEVDFEIEY